MTCAAPTSERCGSSQQESKSNQCCTSIPSNLADSSHKMRTGLAVCHASTWPRSFHSSHSSSIWKPRPHQGQRLFCCQQAEWHIGEHDHPLRQLPLARTDGFVLLMRSLFKLIAPPHAHVLGHLVGDQARLHL